MATPTRVLFRNYTDIMQSYHLPSGEKVGPVRPGNTVFLPRQFGENHANTLELVTDEIAQEMMDADPNPGSVMVEPSTGEPN